ncbi:MAG: hypothetical protein K2P51_02430 [Rhabdochlamydiaceae bacterium]|nr:hypothetical protein [Rhabdochlamydiaceae bacterium]
MLQRLYLSDAFGWDTEARSKVALSQLREDVPSYRTTCPKAQLIKNCSYHWQPNTIKFLGYIPILNLFAGALAISSAENGREFRPNNKQFWVARGIAMIFTGPALLIADLLKYAYDRSVMAAYGKTHPNYMDQFNTSHRHSIAFWTGHPIECLS